MFHHTGAESDIIFIGEQKTLLSQSSVSKERGCVDREFQERQSCSKLKWCALRGQPPNQGNGSPANIIDGNMHGLNNKSSEFNEKARTWRDCTVYDEGATHTGRIGKNPPRIHNRNGKVKSVSIRIFTKRNSHQLHIMFPELDKESKGCNWNFNSRMRGMASDNLCGIFTAVGEAQLIHSLDIFSHPQTFPIDVVHALGANRQQSKPVFNSLTIDLDEIEEKATTKQN